MELNYGMSLEQKQQLSQNQIQSLEFLAMDGVELSEFLQDEYLENPLSWITRRGMRCRAAGKDIGQTYRTAAGIGTELRRYCGGKKTEEEKIFQCRRQKASKLYSGSAAGWSMQPETGRVYDRLSG